MKSTRLMIVFCACLAARGALAGRRGRPARGWRRRRWRRPARRRRRRWRWRPAGGGGGGGSQAVPRTHRRWSMAAQWAVLRRLLPALLRRLLSALLRLRPYYYSPYWYASFRLWLRLRLRLRLVLRAGTTATPAMAGVPYCAYGYAPYPYPVSRPTAYGNWASARLEVKPRDAQVYVDGYLRRHGRSVRRRVPAARPADRRARDRDLREGLSVRTGSGRCSGRARAITSRRSSSRCRRARRKSRRRSRPPEPCRIPIRPAARSARPVHPRSVPPRSDAGRIRIASRRRPASRGRTMPMPDRPGDRRAPEATASAR